MNKLIIFLICIFILSNQINTNIKTYDDMFRVLPLKNKELNSIIPSNFRMSSLKIPDFPMPTENMFDRIKKWDLNYVENYWLNKQTKIIQDTIQSQQNFKSIDIVSPLSMMKDTFVGVIKDTIFESTIKEQILPIIKMIIKMLPNILAVSANILTDIIPFIIEWVGRIIKVIIKQTVLIIKNSINVFVITANSIAAIANQSESLGLTINYSMWTIMNFPDWIIQFLHEVMYITQDITSEIISKIVNLFRIFETSGQTNLQIWFIVKRIPSQFKILVDYLEYILQIFEYTTNTHIDLHQLLDTLLDTFLHLNLFQLTNIIQQYFSQITDSVKSLTSLIDFNFILKILKNIPIQLKWLLKLLKDLSINLKSLISIFDTLPSLEQLSESITNSLNFDLIFRIFNKLFWIISNETTFTPTHSFEFTKSFFLSIDLNSSLIPLFWIRDLFASTTDTDILNQFLSIDFNSLLKTIDSTNPRSSEWFSTYTTDHTTSSMSINTLINQSMSLLRPKLTAEVIIMIILPIKIILNILKLTINLLVATSGLMSETLILFRFFFMVTLQVVFGGTMQTINAFAVDGLKTMIKQTAKFKPRATQDRFGDPKYGDLLTRVMREVQTDQINDEYQRVTGNKL